MGGSATHYHSNPTTGSTALTIDQIPSHTHQLQKAVAFNFTSNNALAYNWGSDYKRFQNIGQLYVNYTGGGAGHNHSMGNTGSSSNIPPYFAVFMWYRTS